MKLAFYYQRKHEEANFFQPTKHKKSRLLNVKNVKRCDLQSYEIKLVVPSRTVLTGNILYLDRDMKPRLNSIDNMRDRTFLA